ncbi:hypothetical protein [Hoeflea alexandrii]
MALDVAIAAIEAGDIKQDRIVADLRKLATSDLSGLDSNATRVASEVRAFIQWIDDPRISFSSKIDEEDKFADLISIARNYQDCTSFFHSEVGVNTSTVWRWASGKSRPSKYVGKRLTSEIEVQLSAVLWQLAWEVGIDKNVDNSILPQCNPKLRLRISIKSDSKLEFICTTSRFE